MKTIAKPVAKTNTLQTLDRGLLALELIATRVGGISIAELAAELEVHRAIAYRLVATLEMHGLVARRRDGRIVAGPGVLRLAASFLPQFRALARPFLERLARDTSATAFVTVAEGEECTALQVCEPEGVDFRVSYRIGSRHPITLGAAGLAILAARPAAAGDPAPLRQARSQGYSLTRGELQQGAVGIACALRGAEGETLPLEACVGVVAMEGLDTARCATLVVACADELGRALTAG